MQKRASAFTLIELLIVVAIIAILAAIAVPNFLEAQTRAKVSRAKSDLRSLATGIEAYIVDNNKPPREYDSSPAVDGPLYGQVNASGVMSPVLSTPIAYVTNAYGLDPFVNLSDNINSDEKFFTYANCVERYAFIEDGGTAWYYTSGSQIDLAERALDKFGAYYMLSIGPDRSYWNNDPGVLSRGGIAGREYIPYDPSNGTISFGNIMRSQKDGLTPNIESFMDAGGPVLGAH